MALTHVLTPIKIGGLEIPNRVVRSAHFTNLGNGVINDDTIAYHLARAKGGVGLTVVEVLSVHPTSPGSNNVWLPANQDGYRKLIDTILPTGMRLFQQLWHAGNVLLPADGSPPWSSSDIPNPLVGVVPIAMTKAMIDEVVEAYARTCEQCERWGLQGVELHGSHTYLPAQFLSPNQNRREDDYGGSFENRARFIIEILTAIRASVSKSMVVGIRVGDDATSGGISVEDYIKLVQMLEARGLLDYVNISMGGYHYTRKIVGGMHEPAGYQLATSVPLSHSTKLPTIVIGRFRTLEEADQVIRAGDADMVAMTRAHIADPDLVRKTVAGHPEQVRPCIGCNQGCLAGINTIMPRMGCVVNPAVGFETAMGDDKLVPAVAPKKVLVVGGGPAGLEAARVAALRGHKVILAEAQNTLGGTLNLAALTPTRHGIRDITVWMEQEIYRLGVEVRLNCYLDADDVLAEQADEVIIATGSTPRMDGMQFSNPGDPIKGMDRSNVISSHELLTSPLRNLGRNAVVIDDLGHFEAIGVAEYLIDKGLSVNFVARHNGLAPPMDLAWMTEPALTRLSTKPFELHTRMRTLSIDDDGVLVGPTYVQDGAGSKKLPADTVVFVSLNHANRDLFNELRNRGLTARIIGDANSPRFLGQAIREGNVIGASI